MLSSCLIAMFILLMEGLMRDELQYKYLFNCNLILLIEILMWVELQGGVIVQIAMLMRMLKLQVNIC
jgi:hypothetical protein